MSVSPEPAAAFAFAYGAVLIVCGNTVPAVKVLPLTVVAAVNVAETSRTSPGSALTAQTAATRTANARLRRKPRARGRPGPGRIPSHRRALPELEPAACRRSRGHPSGGSRLLGRRRREARSSVRWPCHRRVESMTVWLGIRPALSSLRSTRLPPAALVAGVGVLSVVGAAATKGVLAVFTATAVAGSNTFTAGTIDIATTPAAAVVAFNAILPGEAVTNSLVVANNGNSALRYAIS